MLYKKGIFGIVKSDENIMNIVNIIYREFENIYYKSKGLGYGPFLSESITYNRDSNVGKELEKLEEKAKGTYEKIKRVLSLTAILKVNPQNPEKFYMTGSTSRTKSGDSRVVVYVYTKEKISDKKDYKFIKFYLYSILYHELTHAIIQEGNLKYYQFLNEEELKDFNSNIAANNMNKNPLRRLEEKRLVEYDSNLVTEDIFNNIRRILPLLNHSGISIVEYWFEKNELVAHSNHLAALAIILKKEGGNEFSKVRVEDPIIIGDSIEFKLPLSFTSTEVTDEYFNLKKNDYIEIHFPKGYLNRFTKLGHDDIFNYENLNDLEFLIKFKAENYFGLDLNSSFKQKVSDIISNNEEYIFVEYVGLDEMRAFEKSLIVYIGKNLKKILIKSANLIFNNYFSVNKTSMNKIDKLKNFLIKNNLYNKIDKLNIL